MTRWSPPCDVVTLQDRRIEAALADDRAVVVVTMRLARVGGFTARDLSIDYGDDRPSSAWLAQELHRAGLEVSECWDDAEPDEDPPEPDPENVRPFGGRRRE